MYMYMYFDRYLNGIIIIKHVKWYTVFFMYIFIYTVHVHIHVHVHVHVHVHNIITDYTVHLLY